MSHWINKHIKNPLTPSYEHSAVIYHNIMYIFGGEDHNKEYHTNIFKLDLIKLDKWEKEKYNSLIDIPYPKSTHSAVIWEDNMYILNGWTPDLSVRVVQEFQKYNFQKKIWKRVNTKGIPRACYAHRAVVSDDKMYVYGGYVF